MRDPQSDFGALQERGLCLHRASEQAHVIGECCKSLFELYVGEINEGYERMTGRAMTFGLDGGTTSA
jgi:hypothetical protein